MRSARKGKHESLAAYVAIALLAILLSTFAYLVATNSRSVQYDPHSLPNR